MEVGQGELTAGHMVAVADHRIERLRGAFRKRSGFGAGRLVGLAAAAGFLVVAIMDQLDPGPPLFTYSVPILVFFAMWNGGFALAGGLMTAVPEPHTAMPVVREVSRAQ